MKVVIAVCTLAAVALAVTGAPAMGDYFIPEPLMYNRPDPYLRGKRSFGAAYGSPCAAGGYYAPVHAHYGYGAAAHGGYGAASQGGYGAASHGAAYAAPSYGYGAPHYRADDSAETELLNFSDMEPGMSEHMPMARYGYAAPAAHAALPLGYGGQLASAAASGPAFGVFPNANVGGCNVPLLLSCSPSIVPGRLVKGSSYGGGYGAASAAIAPAPAYRAEETHEHERSDDQDHQSLEQTDDSQHSETHQ